MNWWRSHEKPDTTAAAGTERRRDPRIGGRFRVRYSGADADKIVIGYGTITDLSRHGFGIEGGRGIKCGMELALFLEIPDTDTMCIPKATVSWISGRRFGVRLSSVGGLPADWTERVADRSL